MHAWNDSDAGKTDIEQLVYLFDECKRRHPDTFAELMPFGHGLFYGISSEADLRDLWNQRLKFLLRRNPQVPPHAFAKDIEELYPWRSTSVGSERS